MLPSLVVEDDVAFLAPCVGSVAGDEACGKADVVDCDDVRGDGAPAEGDGDGEAPVEGEGEAEPRAGWEGDGELPVSTLMKIGLA